MASYYVFAVKKDRDGDITHCYINISNVLHRTFSSIQDARNYVKMNCTMRTKEVIISDLDSKSYNKTAETKVLKPQNYYSYVFTNGAEIHVVNHKYLRTDSNGTTKDNLDDILEID